MHPAGHYQGHLVVGCGGVSAEPGIDLRNETWLHSVFVCPLHMDVSVSITEFLSKSKLVQSGITVPGSKDANQKESRARPNLLRLLRQWYEVLWRLRRAGFTLRGNFCCDNFRVFQPKQEEKRRKRRRGLQPRTPDRPAEDRIEVRMTGCINLSRYSPEDAEQDDRTFVWCVRELLNMGEHVPRDIGDWLDLINYRGVGNEYLVRYHVSLMDPRAGFSVLMSYRKRIAFLKPRKPDVYETILHMMSPYRDWNSQVLQFQNNLMEAARLFILGQSGKTQQEGFAPDVGGILKVIRDCGEHPARRFENFMLLIVEEDFRAFVARLHWVMFRTGQLPFLHLETTMGC